MATFVLLANQQRGDAETPKLTLKPGTTTLRLQLTTEEGLDSGSYSAIVTDAQGANILTAAHLIPRTEAARRYIASYEIVTGQPFVPDPREPIGRIAAALDAR